MLMTKPPSPILFFFFFNDTATTEIYTLSLHDALPIYHLPLLARVGSHYSHARRRHRDCDRAGLPFRLDAYGDRKSTRLNSSHLVISYAVFCLKKKTQNINAHRSTLLPECVQNQLQCIS